MFTFIVVSSGTRQITINFHKYAERMRNLRPAFEEIYLRILQITKENFETEGSRGGSPKWTPLSELYVVQKARSGLRTEILQASGLLMESMTSYRHPLQYTRIERYKIVFTPRLLRGKVHQTGAFVPHPTKSGPMHGGGIPRRPFVRFNREDHEEFGRTILRFVIRRAAMRA